MRNHNNKIIKNCSNVLIIVLKNNAVNKIKCTNYSSFLGESVSISHYPPVITHLRYET